MQETEDTQNGKTSHVQELEILILLKCPLLPKAIYTFNVILIKI